MSLHTYPTRNKYTDCPPPLQDSPEDCSHPTNGKLHCLHNQAMAMECTTCGPHCSNHQLQSLRPTPTSTFLTTDKGLGLRTEIDLEADQLIDEYTGEVITKARYTHRNRTKPPDAPFYFASLQPGYVIDAEHHGNNMRYINNSCQSNCTMRRIQIGPNYHLAVFAKHNIPAGTELTLTYFPYSPPPHDIPCCCGEHTCSGWMGRPRRTKDIHGKPRPEAVRTEFNPSSSSIPENPKPQLSPTPLSFLDITRLYPISYLAPPDSPPTPHLQHDSPWFLTHGLPSRLTDKNLDDFFYAWSEMVDDVCYMPYDFPATPKRLRKHHTPQTLILHSFFYTKLSTSNAHSTSNYDFNAVAPLTSRINPSRLKHVFLAIHHPGNIGHWTLTQINVESRRILHYDSSPHRSPIDNIGRNLIQWWNDFNSSKSPSYLPTSRNEWHNSFRKSPHQTHLFDCGVHLCSNLASLTSPSPTIQYTSEQSPFLRAWMFSLIISSRRHLTTTPDTQLHTQITPDRLTQTTHSILPPPPPLTNSNDLVQPPPNTPACHHPPTPTHDTSSTGPEAAPHSSLPVNHCNLLPTHTPPHSPPQDPKLLLQHTFWMNLTHLPSTKTEILSKTEVLNAIKASDPRLRACLSDFTNWSEPDLNFLSRPTFHRSKHHFNQIIHVILDEINNEARTTPLVENPPPPTIPHDSS
jgi:hypothetical protein